MLHRNDADEHGRAAAARHRDGLLHGGNEADAFEDEVGAASGAPRTLPRYWPVYTGFRFDMPKYIDFYLDGRVYLDEMISSRIKLDEVNQAFDRMRKGEAARQVIVFD